MATPDNPNESLTPESPSQPTGPPRRCSRFWYLFGSPALLWGGLWCLQWLASLGWINLPEREEHFIEIASLGGQAFLVATWGWIFGWFFLAFAWRRAAIAATGIATLCFAAFPALYDPTDYGSLQWWTIWAACLLLTIGALRLPRKSASGSDGRARGT